MAAVYLAADTVLDRLVAVKILHAELGREPSFRERFRREAQAIAKLNHPNIVSVFDSGEDTVDGDVVPYIVMEYVEGKSLRDVLEEDASQHGAMPAVKALKIVSEILAALQASHEMSLVHRDIKPANVMLTGRNVVKVMDFGIARALQSSSSMTQTGAVIGTPQYLSPEQALGREVDARSDLYSVGCLLFELLTGRLPFDGESALAIAYKHVQEEPPLPSMFNPQVTPPLDALVSHALQKHASARFPTAEAMHQAVTAAITVSNTVTLPAAGTAHINTGTPAYYNSNARQVGWDPGTAAQSTPPALHYMQPQAPSGVERAAPRTPTASANWNHAPSLPPHTSTAPGVPRQRRKRHAAAVAGTVLGVCALAGAVVTIIPENQRTPTPEAGAVSSAPPVTGTPPSPLQSGSISPSPSLQDAPSTTPAPSTSIRKGDPALTMKPSDCMDQFNFSDGQVSVPFFKLHHILSVRACARAGGWTLVEKDFNETIWGQGIVVNQSPYSTLVKASEKTVTIWVSTGHA
ncbi:protein kinase [Streptomyces sp. NPDC058661]